MKCIYHSLPGVSRTVLGCKSRWDPCCTKAKAIISSAKHFLFFFICKILSCFWEFPKKRCIYTQPWHQPTPPQHSLIWQGSGVGRTLSSKTNKKNPDGLSFCLNPLRLFSSLQTPVSAGFPIPAPLQPQAHS